MSKSGSSRRRYVLWRIYCGAALALTFLTFSPTVLEQGSRRILSLPSSLVVGIVIALGFLVLTVAASRSYPEDTDDGDF